MKASKPLFLLFAVLLGSVFFLLQLPKLQFNYDFDRFFPKGDPDLAYYQSLTNQFGQDNDFLLIGIRSRTSVFDSTFLVKIDQLTQELSEYEEVRRLQSPTNFSRIQITPLGVNRVRPIRSRRKVNIEQVMKDHLIAGRLISQDQRSICMILEHQAFDTKPNADQFYEVIASNIASYDFEEVVISGKIQAQNEFVKRLEGELSRLLLIAVAFVVVVLFIIYRTWQGVVIPLLAVALTSIWNMGIIALAGKEIDVMVVMIPPILLIVAMSDIVHICAKYNELFRQGLSLGACVRQTVKEVGMATFLTSVTTAVGFATLAVSPIAPIRDFGLFTALGIMIAYIVAFLFIPPLLILLKKPINRSKRIELRWQKFMHMGFQGLLHNRRKVGLMTVLFSVFLALGIFQIQRNTFIVVGISKSDPLVKPVLFFDEHFEGYKPFQMTVELPNAEALFDPEILRRLDALEKQLANDYELRHLQSPLEFIKLLHQATHAGAASAYSIPHPEDLARVKRLLKNRRFSEDYERLISPDGKTLRIIGRTADEGSAVSRIKNQRLEDYLETSGLQAQLTGTSYLIDKTDDYIVTSVLNGLLAALLVISILLLILFRDVVLVLISLIPNVLPLLILAGIMGFAHIDLNISTAIIFSVAFGIAVDDSIHFLSRYTLELRTGKQPLYAVKRSFLSTGKAIIITSIVLASGFLIFLFSGFTATYYTGLFVGLSLIFALLTDLSCLPLLLIFLHRGRKR